jgi:hypothetical protein
MSAARSSKGSADGVVLTTAKGHQIRVELAIATLVSLRHQTPAALRIEPSVFQQSDDLPLVCRVGPRFCEEDLAQIDQVVFDFAAQLLAEGLSQPALILPVSFFTLAARKGRLAFAKIADQPKLLKSSVMVELADVDRGMPISRLIEVGSQMTALCRAVLVRVQPGIDMLSAVRGYRPHGITLDAADLADTDSQIAGQLLSFGDQARGAAPLLLVQGLTDDGFFNVAEVAGLTHAALRAPSPKRRKSAA